MPLVYYYSGSGGGSLNSISSSLLLTGDNSLLNILLQVSEKIAYNIRRNVTKIVINITTINHIIDGANAQAPIKNACGPPKKVQIAKNIAINTIATTKVTIAGIITPIKNDRAIIGKINFIESIITVKL